MKTSIVLFLSDILPHRKKAYHKVVKNKIFKGKTIAEVFQHFKKIGLDGYELMLPQYTETTNKDIHEIQELAKKYKFPVLSVHQALRFLTATKIKEVVRLFEVADMVGAKVIVLHINAARKQIFDEKYIQSLHDLEKKYKIKVTFENMEKHVESYFYAHRWHPVKFADLVKKTNFHITLDTVHLAHSGGDILRFFKENKERILNVHLSDYRFHPLNSSLRPMRYKHMPLGDGELPIDKFISLLQKDKYKGLITLELYSELGGVERSMTQINNLLHPRPAKKA